MDWLNRVMILNNSFKEQKAVVTKVWALADELLGDVTSQGIFSVSLKPLPPEFLKFKKNIFSSLFISIFHIIDINPARRELFACINHLFRVWVTSADNLLDNEEKITFSLQLPGQSKVMHQVVAIMLADRILHALLAEAVAEGTITVAESNLISAKSLQILLPSAAEEAMEEGGMENIPTAQFVLEQIHPIKTGVLFHIPFLGPDTIEPNLNRELVDRIKSALLKFGIGCQLLDDIRDLNRDFVEKRGNYFVARLAEEGKAYIQNLEALSSTQDLDKFVALEFPEMTSEVLKLALENLTSAIKELDQCGFKGFQLARKQIIGFLITTMDLTSIKKMVTYE